MPPPPRGPMATSFRQALPPPPGGPKANPFRKPVPPPARGPQALPLRPAVPPPARGPKAPSRPAAFVNTRAAADPALVAERLATLAAKARSARSAAQPRRVPPTPGPTTVRDPPAPQVRTTVAPSCRVLPHPQVQAAGPTGRSVLRPHTVRTVDGQQLPVHVAKPPARTDKTCKTSKTVSWGVTEAMASGITFFIPSTLRPTIDQRDFDLVIRKVSRRIGHLHETKEEWTGSESKELLCLLAAKNGAELDVPEWLDDALYISGFLDGYKGRRDTSPPRKSRRRRILAE
ncbi:hypothetical protein ANO11243_012730 [Dothideomycetidae sp. 11243]|nr:hypothetical protein ANO11243_012730 [fungal sp. No.11243]